MGNGEVQRRTRAVCNVCGKAFNDRNEGGMRFHNAEGNKKAYCEGSLRRPSERFVEVQLPGEKKWHRLPEDHPAARLRWPKPGQLEEIMQKHPLEGVKK